MRLSLAEREEITLGITRGETAVSIAGRLGRAASQQIAARLRLDFPDDPEMRLSHETIYQSLYVQSRGALRRELARQLRTRRSYRELRGSRMGGTLHDMLPIAERPAEVDDRAGLVDGKTRCVMLVQMPDGPTAESVRAALTETIQRLPEALRRTLTWDQGNEMVEHARRAWALGRRPIVGRPFGGTNENTNGLLPVLPERRRPLLVFVPKE